MNTIITFSLLFYIVIIIILIIVIIKQNKNINKLKIDKNKLEERGKEELETYFKEKWDDESQKFQLKYDKLQGDINQLNTSLKEKEKRYKEVNQDLDLYKEGKTKEIDSAAAEYEKRRRLLVNQSIDKYRTETIVRANELLEKFAEDVELSKEELKVIKTELEEERQRRAAVNEEIRRQRAIEEQQDFYCIQLDPNDINDIELLKSITPRLRHPEAINKIIWTGYYQKPLAELRKRVAVEDSGVYKITRIKTNEIYIGQAVNVSTRWAEHVKTALGVGTLASSQLHKTMALDGPENFIFELLEKTPKEKLRERESYYINFYDSKNYGLNTLSGDKNK